MDSQRTSALQQRLQARREMFMKENSVGGAVANGAPPTPGKLAAVGGAPVGAPPQPPTTAPRALSALREE